MFRKKYKLSRQRGFTLIELLIVIAILGILASIAINSFRGTQLRARDARRQSDLDTLATSLSRYAIDNNDAFPCSGGNCAANGGWGAITTTWPNLSAYGLRENPTDSVSATPYMYRSMAGQTFFCLSTKMEDPSNAKAPPTGCTNYTGYNYTVAR